MRAKGSNPALPLLLLGIVLATSRALPVASQTTAPAPAMLVVASLAPAPAPPPPPYSFGRSCHNGVALQYSVQHVAASYPFLDDPALQPYTFKASARLINTGDRELRNWQLFVGFRHHEILVSVGSGAALGDGTPLPAPVGNGTSLISTAQPDLETAIETAMDFDRIGITVQITGTEFGVAPPSFPMPANISLVNDGYTCQAPVVSGVVHRLKLRKFEGPCQEANVEFFPMIRKSTGCAMDD